MAGEPKQQRRRVAPRVSAAGICTAITIQTAAQTQGVTTRNRARQQTQPIGAAALQTDRTCGPAAQATEGVAASETPPAQGTDAQGINAADLSDSSDDDYQTATTGATENTTAGGDTVVSAVNSAAGLLDTAA